MSKSSLILKKNVELLRQAVGLSQRAVAAKAKIAHSQLSRYLNGKTAPGLDAIDAIAAALGVTTGQLLTDPDAPGAEPLVVKQQLSEEELLAAVVTLVQKQARAAGLSLPLSPETVSELIAEHRRRKPKK